MAPSVAVCCGLSSKRFSTAGSKVVNELHSSGLASFGEARWEESEWRGGDVKVDEVKDVEAWAFSLLVLPADLGTEKVNDDCLSDKFSL